VGSAGSASANARSSRQTAGSASANARSSRQTAGSANAVVDTVLLFTLFIIYTLEDLKWDTLQGFFISEKCNF
jgi:hypothetical protein